MNRKNLFLLISVIVLFCLSSCDPLANSIADGIAAFDTATDPQAHEMYFNINGNTAYLNTNDNLPSSLLIPQTVGGNAVTAVENCTGSFTSVRIPGHVKTIKEEAFAGCTNLETVVIDDGVELIESLAFDGCTYLTLVIFNCSEMPEIEPGAFPLGNGIEYRHGTQSYDNLNALLAAL